MHNLWSVGSVRASIRSQWNQSNSCEDVTGKLYGWLLCKADLTLLLWKLFRDQSALIDCSRKIKFWDVDLSNITSNILLLLCNILLPALIEMFDVFVTDSYNSCVFRLAQCSYQVHLPERNAIIFNERHLFCYSA